VRALEITTSVGDPAVARAIAEALLASKHAACVKLVGRACSRYWWQGTIERADEEIVLALTTRAHADAVRTLIEDLHPYEVPEIVARDIEVLEPSYASWLRESLGDEEDVTASDR